MSSTFILFASVFLISTVSSISPPGNFTWPLNTKNLCFVGHFDLILNVEYLKKNGTQVSAKVPMNNMTYESYSVSCASPTNIHELTISMLNGFTNIIFHFSVDDKNKTSLTKIYGYVTFNDQQTFFTDYPADLEGVHKFSSNQSLFEANRGNSYRCNTKSVIEHFTTNDNVTIKSIEIENLHIQPFADDSKEFSYGVEIVCSADVNKNSNLIPIIVGACLGVLVIIVLVAYLIGRRRSRTGYQSV